MSSALSQKQKKYLKQQAHHLSVVVTVGGNGLSESVIQEISTALEKHELLKIKLPAMPKEDKKAAMDQIAAECDAQIVQLIGRTAIFYKAPDSAKSTKPAKYSLPKD